MDAFSVDDDRTKGEAGRGGKNATNLWNMQDIDMKIGEKNGKWIINWALDANVERSDNVSGGEREKIDSERVFSCAVGNWEVYSKEIRWVIFSLFLRIKFDLPAMNSRNKFERDNAGRTLENGADIRYYKQTYTLENMQKIFAIKSEKSISNFIVSWRGTWAVFTMQSAQMPRQPGDAKRRRSSSWNLLFILTVETMFVIKFRWQSRVAAAGAAATTTKSPLQLSKTCQANVDNAAAP